MVTLATKDTKPAIEVGGEYQKLTQQEIFFLKRSKILLAPAILIHGECSLGKVVAFCKNIEAYGYCPTPELLVALRHVAEETVDVIYHDVVPLLKKATGAHRQFKPMYPNFPAQVANASDAELYINAMFHYFGAALADAFNNPDLHLFPQFDVEEREPLQEWVDLRPLGCGTYAEFDAIFTQLAGANTSLSDTDKSILRWFTANVPVEALMPPRIQQRETLAMLVSWLGAPAYLAKHLTTAHDVLRVAVVLCGGDVSLAEATKFKRIPRAVRRFLLGVLNQCQNPTEDMLLRRERWLRLGEALHPSEYAKQFPLADGAFGVLRKNLPYTTFNSGVESAIKTKDTKAALELLRQRPGVFARRLDHLLRITQVEDAPRIVAAFGSVTDKVSTPVLLQVHAHFKNRDASAVRTFFPKGNVARLQTAEECLPILPPYITEDVVRVAQAALIQRFATLPRLGNVYVDEQLRKHFVPFGCRSASRSLRVISRGSRMALEGEGDTVRFFLWWKDAQAQGDYGTNLTDIDLTAVFLHDDFSMGAMVAYHNLREHGCYHSGDIRSAPKGACEFIDVNMKEARRHGRYVVCCVNSFSGQFFTSLPECFAGWMLREKPRSGEIFDARTVRDKVDLSAATRFCVPALIDMEEREVIWADLALASNSILYSAWRIHNAASNTRGISMMARALATLRRPTLYDLFALHGIARGTLTDQAAAQTIMSVHAGITPFDGDKIRSEFLA